MENTLPLSTQEYKYTYQKMQISYFNIADFYCDGGAAFGVVPKKVWSKRYPADEENFCRMTMRCVLIKTDDRLMLVDTGVGTKQLQYLKYYKITEIADFHQELAKFGYTCEQVTDVILTHLHFDHCGGCTFIDADGMCKPQFPNANYWVSELQWQNFLHPNVREGNSYFPENMMPVQEAGLLRLIKEDTWIHPEVQLRIYSGHTDGIVMPFLPNYDGGTFLINDIIPMAASLPLAWVSATDTQPLLSMKAKESILAEAAQNGFSLFFEHDAYVVKGRVQLVNGHYKLVDCLMA